MKAKARTRKVVGYQHEEVIANVQHRPYSEIKKSLESLGQKFAAEIINLMVTEGITITGVRTRMAENVEPTISELKTAYTVEVTIEGAPYERSILEIS